MRERNSPGEARKYQGFKKRLKVGLLWHSVNSNNLGVGALTASQVSIIETIANEFESAVDFTIIGWFDKQKPYISGENIRHHALRSRDFVPWGALHRVVRSCDLICDIGAGDSFADIYGLKRFLYMWTSKLIVLLARRPLILSPQTIGPFTKFGTSASVGLILPRCKAIVVRDELSRDFLSTIDGLNNVESATDVAFRLPYTHPTKPADGVVRIGLNVSGLLFAGGYDGRNMFGLKSDYRSLIRKLLRYFIEQPRCEVHLVSHVVSDDDPVEDDLRVATSLAEEFPSVVVVPRFRDPSDAKSYIARLDFFCGSRMHACIAAFSSGVPVVPMAYSRKFQGLFGSLGYLHVADCKSESDDEIVGKVAACFENRATLRDELSRANAKANEKLGIYDEVLRRWIGESVNAGRHA